jgi:DNA-binding NarL/FixJ family response regulator
MREPDIANIVLYAVLTAALVLVAMEVRGRMRRRRDDAPSSSTNAPSVQMHADAPAPREPVPPSAFAALTPREKQIAYLAAQGLTNRQISAETGLSVNTISNHLKRVYAKLGVQSRTELAWRLQYLDMDTDDPPDVDG